MAVEEIVQPDPASSLATSSDRIQNIIAMEEEVASEA